MNKHLCVLFLCLIQSWTNAQFRKAESDGWYTDLTEAAKNPLNVINLSISEPISRKDIPTLKALTNLKAVSIWCSNSKEINDEIFDLVQLEYLSINCTKKLVLSDRIAKLKELESLELSSYSEVALPESIGSLSSLKTFKIDIYRANTEQDLPIEFKELKNLEYVEIRCSEDDFVNIICELPNIVELTQRSSWCFLPCEISKLEKLKQFYWIVDARNIDISMNCDLRNHKSLEKVTIYTNFCCWPYFDDVTKEDVEFIQFLLPANCILSGITKLGIEVIQSDIQLR